MPQDINKEPINTGKTLAQWQFPEFIKYEHSRRWYIMFTLVMVLLLIYSLATANILFTVIIIIAALIITMNKKRQPRDVDFKITEEGIIVDETLYQWKEIKHFWIVYEPPQVKTLYLEFNSWHLPRLPIPLLDNNPLDLREILLDYLDEDIEREGEPISDGLSRGFKI